MIEAKQSVICGTIKNMDINDIKDHIYRSIIGELRYWDGKTKDDLNCSDIGFYLKHHIFHPKFLHINAKNIEYQESFHLTDMFHSQVDIEILQKFGFADILFELVIYRIGQYSYFSCDLTFLHPDPKQAENS